MKLLLLSAAVAAAALLSGCGENSAAEAMDRGIRRASNGDWRGARKYSLRAIELEPENPDALVFHAIVCDRLGEYDPALDAARRAVERAPESFVANYLVGKLYSETPERSAQALVSLHKAVRLAPENTNARICLVNAAMKLKTPQAENYINQLRRMPGFENSPELLNQLGVISFRKGDFKTARGFFIAAFRNDPERRRPAILFNIAADFDREPAMRSKAEAFYREFLRLASGGSELAAAVKYAGTRLNGR